ncbi:MAG: glycosyltransferase [Acidobacteria bacterium]|nr:glycosyltransferase [Acidobacteriota bacterium]
MKILVVVHGFPPTAQGGAEIYAHAHARVLREHYGDEIVVFTSEQNPDRADYDVRSEQRDGLRVVRVNNTFRHTRTFEETYRNEAIGAMAATLIDDFKPDVAHIHHLTRLSTTIVRSLAERRIPCFVTLHDYWLLCHRGQLLDVDYHVCDGPGREDVSGCRACLGPAAAAGPVGFMGATAVRALERRLPAAPARQLRRVTGRLASFVARDGEAEEHARKRLEHMREVCGDVTHFLAPSRFMCDQFVRFGVAPDRITVADYGFDHAPFRDIERTASDRRVGRVLSDPALRLGFLGSLMISKGPDVLLRAIGALPRGSVSVDLYGAPVDYHGDDRYRRQLDPLLNQQAVQVHGAIAHDRVAHALSALDVLVVPSIWPENSPLVIHEAFLAGVPVVAARIGGIPELVEDGRNGLLFRAGDAEDLARALTRLVREPGLLETLRAGIPLVRTIEEDVRLSRRLYESHMSAYGAAHVSPVRVAAVVLNYRTPDDTFLAVRSLLASQRAIDEVIVVDNDRGDSPGGAREVLRDVRPNVRYLQTGSNLGFSGGMNVGIREALARGADRVLLVNSDVIVPPDCVERLERCLEATPATGIAGPVVLARSEPDRIASLGMSYSPASGRMRHRGFGARVAAEGQPSVRIVDGVSGCLMLVRREVFEAVGLLDEEYFFSFEDLDFCLKARRAGFATVLAGTAVAYHEGGRSLEATSPRRLYFAARNHLLVARRTGPPSSRMGLMWRAASIVMLNLAHAARWRGGSLPDRFGAVVRGTRDYVAGRFGADA